MAKRKKKYEPTTLVIEQIISKLKVFARWELVRTMAWTATRNENDKNYVKAVRNKHIIAESIGNYILIGYTRYCSLSGYNKSEWKSRVHKFSYYLDDALFPLLVIDTANWAEESGKNNGDAYTKYIDDFIEFNESVFDDIRKELL